MIKNPQRKKDLQIYKEYKKKIEQGWLKMSAYESLAAKYKMSVSGIRIAILRGSDYARPVAPPLSDEEI